MIEALKDAKTMQILHLILTNKLHKGQLMYESLIEKVKIEDLKGGKTIIAIRDAITKETIDGKKIIQVLRDGARMKREWSNGQKGKLLTKTLPNLDAFEGDFIGEELHG